MKRLLFFILLLAIISGNSIGQNSPRVLKKIMLCKEQPICSVDFEHLNNSLPKKYKKPRIAPLFSGGKTMLLKYFEKKKIKDFRADGEILRVYVGFIVNCKGEAGNFRLIGDYGEKQKIIAIKVLNIVSEMPQSWNPAQFKQDKVNCWQALSLTIIDTKFTTIYYQR